MDEKEYELNHVGETILKKYNDKPLYAQKDVQSDLGYADRPKVPWSHDVIHKAKSNHSQLESPIKEWWKSEQRKQGKHV